MCLKARLAYINKLLWCNFTFYVKSRIPFRLNEKIDLTKQKLSHAFDD